MKWTAIVLTATFAAFGCAFGAGENNQATADDAALKERIKAWKAESGGYVTKEDPANGKVVVVNRQTRVDAKALKLTARYYKEFTSSMPFEVADTDRDATFAVIVKNDESDAHPLSIWPEERRAAVNVAALAKGATDAAALEMRVRKEVSRAIAHLVGGGSQYAGTLAGSLTSTAELDKFKDDAMPPDVFMRIGTNLRAAGVRPIYRVTYRQACHEGWAPPPANERQKAVWEQVKAEQSAGPKKPIKIEFDPKKGR